MVLLNDYRCKLNCTSNPPLQQHINAALTDPQLPDVPDGAGKQTIFHPDFYNFQKINFKIFINSYQLVQKCGF